ncbi:GGL domain-containing protein [Cunninghamella echinulata]|nr:GGL domain-containing protein [Cunninghamella echinulata]
MFKRHTREELAELKLRRLLMQNLSLRAQLEVSRLPVSEASQTLIDYCSNTQDPFLPSVWGEKQEDPFGQSKKKWMCCNVM